MVPDSPGSPVLPGGWSRAEPDGRSARSWRQDGGGIEHERLERGRRIPAELILTASGRGGVGAALAALGEGLVHAVLDQIKCCSSLRRPIGKP